MSLILNGTTISDVYLNGVKVDSAYLNGTKVYQAPISINYVNYGGTTFEAGTFTNTYASAYYERNYDGAYSVDIPYLFVANGNTSYQNTASPLVPIGVPVRLSFNATFIGTASWTPSGVYSNLKMYATNMSLNSIQNVSLYLDGSPIGVTVNHSTTDSIAFYLFQVNGSTFGTHTVSLTMDCVFANTGAFCGLQPTEGFYVSGSGWGRIVAQNYSASYTLL